MKLGIIIATLTLSSASTFAQEVTNAYMANAGGGKTVMVGEDCQLINIAQRLKSEKMSYPGRAYSYNSTGKSMNGCWNIEDGLYHVIWENGTEYRYPLSLFKFDKRH